VSRTYRRRATKEGYACSSVQEEGLANMLRISFPSLDLATYQRVLDEIYDTSTSAFVLYYAVVIGFCALLRSLVLNQIHDCPLRPRLLEAITCGEQYACWLGHLRVSLVYGTDVGLAALAGASLYRWMTQCPGTTANPLSYMLAFVVGQCCMTVEEMCSRIGIQVCTEHARHQYDFTRDDSVTVA